MTEGWGFISFGWIELPAYAARLIKSIPGDFPIVATHPTVPIQGMEDILPNRIKWIDPDYNGGWSGLSLPIPSIYFQPSWFIPSFVKLGDEVRAAGGSVVIIFDNCFKGDLRQVFGALKFRTQWRNKYSAAWVPGKSGAKLAKLWGFESSKVFMGLYGADLSLFGSPKKALRDRPRRFIFIGQLITRKGVDCILRAWNEFIGLNHDWELHLYGDGPLRSLIKEKLIYVHGFQQPEVVSAALADSRFLILPSREEHWGLVVCEAAQSGCGLLLGRAVGSGPDLLTPDNGRLIDVDDSESLLKQMIWAASLPSTELDKVEAESYSRGAIFTPANFRNNFDRIISVLE